MSNLHYWKAHNRDEPCFGKRGRTKKECQAKVDAAWNSEDFDAPEKIHICYSGGVLGLLDEVLGECQNAY